MMPEDAQEVSSPPVAGDGPPTTEYTIDELAAHTSVPSRTIRFYQSKGALHKPEIRGRKAIYTDDHVERLALIDKLQERGLRIRAIRDLVMRIDAGELALDEWLGLEARLQASWVDDSPRIYSTDELAELVSRRSAVADLDRLGLIERRGDSWLVQSPALVKAFVEMEAAGIDMDVAKGAVDLARKHLSRLAVALAKHYVYHAGDGFGKSRAPRDLAQAFEAARPLSRTLVQTLFSEEMEAQLRDFVESGRAAKVTGSSS